MADKTVYPFGVGGQLPSNIGLVNDLVTGGADKALAAEQGKVIGADLYGQTVFTWDNGAINNNNRYYRYLTQKVTKGDMVIFGLSSYTGYNIAIATTADKQYSSASVTDTGWVSSTLRVLVGDANDDCYLRIVVRKSNNGSITVGEAEALINQLTVIPATHIYEGILPADAEPKEGSDKVVPSGYLHNVLLGPIPRLDNENASADTYGTYTTSGKDRGYVYFNVFKAPAYMVRLSVKEDSAFKFSVQLRAALSFSGNAVYSSDWVSPGNTLVVTQNSGNDSVHYAIIVATDVSTSAVAPTLQEFLDSVDFTIEGGESKDGLVPKVSALDDEVFGNVQPVITNLNFDDSVYTSETVNGNVRGVLPFVVPEVFNFIATVKEDSTIKLGVQARDRYTSSTNTYASDWITPGNSYIAPVREFMNTRYLVLVIAYTNGSGAPTVAEIRQYISFEFSIGQKSIEEKLAGFLKYDGKGLIAHRGLHKNAIPENSIDAYRYAGYAKFEFAETDFCATKDGHLVLMHDASINRTMENMDGTTISGTVYVKDKTLAELQENYVLKSSDKRFKRTIPLLRDFFLTCKQYGVFPLPEIKETGVNFDHIKAAYDMGCEILGEGNFGFCSFSAMFLDYVRSMSKKTPLFYISTTSILDTYHRSGESRNNPLNVWYPSYDNANLTASVVAAYHAKGMKVAVYTVPTSQGDSVLKMGVDIIASDNMFPTAVHEGVWIESDRNFSPFTTDGTVVNDALTLSAGQSVSYTGELAWLGGYYLEIIGKGSFSIACPNLTKSIVSADIDTFRFDGVVDNTTFGLTITATDDCEIQFISFKVVKLRP